MSELLLELFSEEIPARLQATAERDLQRLFLDFCKKTSLGCDDVQTFSTPRRFGMVVTGMAKNLPASKTLTKGPRLGAAPAALDGFCRKLGIETANLSENDGFYWAEIHQAERSTLPLIEEGLTSIINSFPWAKTMRSGRSDFRWIRPLRSILCLFDNEIIPLKINGLVAKNVTYGHRFLSDCQPISVLSFADYQAKLKAAKVLIHRHDRKSAIIEKSQILCTQQGLVLIQDEDLLDEVVGLVEWPHPLIGPMNPQFLSLPPEVIRTSMRTHQKYFALKQSDTGPLSPHFLLVSHMEPKDEGAEIIRGNAKVLSARLSDAQFFYQEDQKEGNFDRWQQSMKGVTHHAKLGSLWMRAVRVQNLAMGLAPLFGIEPAQAQLTATLIKADLASAMVGEFPELQGLMGGDYANKASHPDAIGVAIAEHYRPQGPQDRLPQTDLGGLMALCDKLDTLFGFFAIDEKPTGSKDPFALRRSALGILRILRQFRVDMDIKSMLSLWYQGLLHYAGAGVCVFIDAKEFDGSAGPRWNHGGNETYQNYLRMFRKGLEESDVKILSTDRDYDLDLRFEIVDRPNKPQNPLYHFRAMPIVLADLEEFLDARLKVMIKDQGLRWEMDDQVSPAMVLEGANEAVGAIPNLSLIQRLERIDTIGAAQNNGDMDQVLAGFKRAHNILELAKYATKIIMPRIEDLADHSADDMVENTFVQSINTLCQNWHSEPNHAQWSENFSKFAALKQPLDAFLDGVLVMDSDESKRARRLDLLAIYREMGLRLADWTKLLGA